MEYTIYGNGDGECYCVRREEMRKEKWGKREIEREVERERKE